MTTFTSLATLPSLGLATASSLDFASLPVGASLTPLGEGLVGQGLASPQEIAAARLLRADGTVLPPLWRPDLAGGAARIVPPDLLAREHRSDEPPALAATVAIPLSPIRHLASVEGVPPLLDGDVSPPTPLQFFETPDPDDSGLGRRDGRRDQPTGPLDYVLRWMVDSSPPRNRHWVFDAFMETVLTGVYLLRDVEDSFREVRSIVRGGGASRGMRPAEIAAEIISRGIAAPLNLVLSVFLLVLGTIGAAGAFIPAFVVVPATRGMLKFLQLGGGAANPAIRRTRKLHSMIIRGKIDLTEMEPLQKPDLVLLTAEHLRYVKKMIKGDHGSRRIVQNSVKLLEYILEREEWDGFIVDDHDLLEVMGTNPAKIRELRDQLAIRRSGDRKSS